MNYDPKIQSKEIMYGKYQEITKKVMPTPVADPVPETYKIEGCKNKAKHQATLSSNCFTTGESSLQHYKNLEKSKPNVIDLVVGNLPENFHSKNLERLSGSKLSVLSLMKIILEVSVRELVEFK